jgi:tritrans,polycis-undecaprenyl-diphosphate synthase [geranylgeranyl-diphosphate specific]
MINWLLHKLGVYKIYKWYLLRQIKNKPMPSHIGVILDGNRRWARENGLPIWLGHSTGAEKVKLLLKKCLELKIKTLTLYAFSTENFQRDKQEIDYLMKLFEEKMKEILDSKEIHQNKVRVKFLGKKEMLPVSLQQLMSRIEERTKNYDAYYLNIAIAYGGRAEIIDAIKKLIEDVLENRLKLEKIDEEEINKRLYTSHLPNPYPDLIIRTSGEERLSGFLLWQSAYSEFCFLDTYWPEFRDIDLYRAIRTYQKRNRRFGK